MASLSQCCGRIFTPLRGRRRGNAAEGAPPAVCSAVLRPHLLADERPKLLRDDPTERLQGLLPALGGQHGPELGRRYLWPGRRRHGGGLGRGWDLRMAGLLAADAYGRGTSPPAFLRPPTRL
jgi:hypothetical protein